MSVVTQRRPNNTEAAFLDLQRRRMERGEILGYSYESHRLALAEGAFYTPDVPVVELDRSKTFYEVKGAKRTPGSKRFPLGNIVPYCRPAERIRIKVAASLYPQHRFIMVWPLGPFEWGVRNYSAIGAREVQGG